MKQKIIQLTTIAIITLVASFFSLYALYNYLPISLLGSQDEQSFGSTITTINASDTLKNSRTTINDNFTSLNNGKIETTATTSSYFTSFPNLATIGTISSGTWNGTTIGVPYGGTGRTSLTQYSVLLGNGTNGISTTSAGTDGQVLAYSSTSTPYWATVGVNQADNYSWTGTHSFAGTTTFTGITTGINKFGGTGADGALNVTTGTTTLNLASSSYFVKNYTSINISAGAALAFGTSSATGTVIHLKSSGACTIAGTIYAVGNGASGGAGSGTGGVDSTVGYNSGHIIDDATTHAGQPTTSGGTVGGTAGTVLLLKRLYAVNGASTLGMRAMLVTPGSGGAGGAGAVTATLGGSGGAGGSGGGSVILECNSGLTFSGTVNVSGTNGTAGESKSGNATSVVGGSGGGGGSAGMFVALYNGSGSISGTVISSGGNGGAGGDATHTGGGSTASCNNGASGGGAGSFNGAGGAGKSSLGAATSNDNGTAGDNASGAGAGGGGGTGARRVTDGSQTGGAGGSGVAGMSYIISVNTYF